MAHPSVVINNVQYADCPEVDIPKVGGGTAKFYDASQADVTASDVLNGKKFVGQSGEGTGNIPVNGATGGTINTKYGTVTIPAGFTSGGTVQLGSVDDCLPQNILSGKAILGVNGTLVTPTISQDATSHILSIS